MTRTFHGSCHCGAIAFETELDLSQGIRKCNCSFCWKLGYRKAFAAYDALRIVRGRDAMHDYQPVPLHWPPGDINHYHCPHCGAHPFSRGRLEMMGGDFWAVNVACLDDATEQELAAAPVIYEDGRRDRQLETPQITAYL
jgi:hypothetical protein